MKKTLTSKLKPFVYVYIFIVTQKTQRTMNYHRKLFKILSFMSTASMLGSCPYSLDYKEKQRGRQRK